MAREFMVRVYEDHYLVTTEAGTLAVEKGNLEAHLAAAKAPDKKRTYPKGTRRTRKAKQEATAGTGTEG